MTKKITSGPNRNDFTAKDRVIRRRKWRAAQRPTNPDILGATAFWGGIKPSRYTGKALRALRAWLGVGSVRRITAPDITAQRRSIRLMA